MAHSGKGGGKFIPALPQGWEARYDETNKTYFFIDHVHKKTQWEDPRFQTQKPLAHPLAQITSASAASSLGVGGGPVQLQGAVAMQDLSPRQHPKNQSQNNRTIIESHMTSDVDAAVVNKLKTEFPKATKELITDMLILCHNNEREARDQLNDLGFLTNNSKGKNTSFVSPHHNKSTESTAAKKSTGTHQPTPYASAQPASKKDISDGDKKRLLIQAKGFFPKLDAEVVRIALNECNYDLEEMKILLTAWEKRSSSGESAKSTSAKSGGTSVTSSVASVRSFSPLAGSLEPVGFEDTSTSKLKSPGNSQASVQYSNNSTSPKKNIGAANVVQSSAGNAKGDPASSKSSYSQHARAKQVTKMSEHLLNTTSDLLNHLATTANCCTSGEDEEEKDEEGNKKVEAEGAAGDKDEESRPKQPAQPAVVTSQPVVENRSKVRPQYKTEAKGPDASLRKGPDSTLLTSDYTQANGPDKKICVGPDRSHVVGPQGAAGPDMSLRCGPQSSLLQENRNNVISVVNV